MDALLAKPLKNKVALVTGGGSGIGQATAKVFARQGAAVVVADMDLEGADATVSEIDKFGGEASSVRIDVSDPSDVQAMIDAVLDRHGRIDCAFNNAGISGPMGAVLDEYSLEDWDRVFSVNCRGVMLCMQAEIKQMLKQGGGSIVNTASIWGLVGSFGSSAYVASKHAVVGITKSAGIEYSARGIRVNAVSPGTIRTPILQPAIESFDNFEETMVAAHPIGRIGEPREVGEAVAWLCSDAASFVVGQNLPVDGGFTLQ